MFQIECFLPFLRVGLSSVVLFLWPFSAPAQTVNVNLSVILNTSGQGSESVITIDEIGQIIRVQLRLSQPLEQDIFLRLDAIPDTALSPPNSSCGVSGNTDYVTTESDLVQINAGNILSSLAEFILICNDDSEERNDERLFINIVELLTLNLQGQPQSLGIPSSSNQVTIPDLNIVLNVLSAPGVEGYHGIINILANDIGQPTVFFLDASQSSVAESYEIEEHTGTLSFSLFINRAYDQNLEVLIETIDQGSAIGSSSCQQNIDYVQARNNTPVIVRIRANQRVSERGSIEICNDGQTEQDETFFLRIVLIRIETRLDQTQDVALPPEAFNTIMATILANDSATLSIVDRNLAPFARNQHEIMEGENFIFRIRVDIIDPNIEGSFRYTLELQNENVTADQNDLQPGTPLTEQINFLNVTRERVRTVSTRSDTDLEGDETFLVTLSSDVEGVRILTEQITVTILDNDVTTIDFSTNDYLFSEGETSAVRIALEGTIAVSVRFHVIVDNSDLSTDVIQAVYGAQGDYVINDAEGNPLSQVPSLSEPLVILWNAGDLERRIDITIRDNTLIEGDKRFALKLLIDEDDTVGNTLFDNNLLQLEGTTNEQQTTITIRENDQLNLDITFTQDSQTLTLDTQRLNVKENGGNIAMTMVLSNPSRSSDVTLETDIVLRFSKIPNTALQQDYSDIANEDVPLEANFNAGTIISSGESIETTQEITIIDDQELEGIERFDIEMTNVPNYIDVQIPSRLTIVIEDNDYEDLTVRITLNQELTINRESGVREIRLEEGQATQQRLSLRLDLSVPQRLLTDSPIESELVPIEIEIESANIETEAQATQNTAIRGLDFTGPSSQIVRYDFINDRSYEISFDIINDILKEGEESFTIILRYSRIRGRVTFIDSQGNIIDEPEPLSESEQTSIDRNLIPIVRWKVIIEDNDIPELTALITCSDRTNDCFSRPRNNETNTYFVREPLAGDRVNLIVFVFLTQPVANPITLTFELGDQVGPTRATESVDFIFNSTEIRYENIPGEQVRAITILPDDTLEGNERIEITLKGEGTAGSLPRDSGIEGLELPYTLFVEISESTPITWRVEGHQEDTEVFEGEEVEYTISYTGATLTSADPSISVIVLLILRESRFYANLQDFVSDSQDTTNLFLERLRQAIEDSGEENITAEKEGDTSVRLKFGRGPGSTTTTQVISKSLRFSLPILDDGIFEGNERFDIALTDPSIELGARDSLGSIFEDSQSVITTIVDGRTTNQLAQLSNLVTPLILRAAVPVLSGVVKDQVVRILKNRSALLPRVRRDSVVVDIGTLVNGTTVSTTTEEPSTQASRTKIAPWGLWLSSHLSDVKSGDGTDVDGRVISLWSGVSYRISDDTLLGVLLGYEESSFEVDAMSGRMAGRGFGGGLFGGTTLGEGSLVIDGSAVWMSLTYESDVLEESISGNFDGQRVMVSSNVTGVLNIGRLSFKPGVSFVWAREWQDSYRDSLGVVSPEQKFSFGRITFGPSVSFRIPVNDWIWLEPFAHVQGEYYFDADVPRATVPGVEGFVYGYNPDTVLGERITMGFNGRIGRGFIHLEGAYSGFLNSEYRLIAFGGEVGYNLGSGISLRLSGRSRGSDHTFATHMEWPF